MANAGRFRLARYPPAAIAQYTSGTNTGVSIDVRVSPVNSVPPKVMVMSPQIKTPA